MKRGSDSTRTGAPETSVSVALGYPVHGVSLVSATDTKRFPYEDATFTSS